MTILTQDLTIVNYDYVKTITIMAGEVKISEDKNVDAFELVAEMTDGTEVSLGVFFAESQVEQVIDDITKWLNEVNDYHRLFKIPEHGDLQELHSDYIPPDEAAKTAKKAEKETPLPHLNRNERDV